MSENYSIIHGKKITYPSPLVEEKDKQVPDTSDTSDTSIDNPDINDNKSLTENGNIMTDMTLKFLEVNLLKNRLLTLYKFLKHKVGDPKISGTKCAKCVEVKWRLELQMTSSNSSQRE